MVNRLKVTFALLLVLLILVGGVFFVSAQEPIKIGLEAEIGRYKAWCTVAEDKLFIFGGENWEEPVPTEYYDFNTSEWGKYNIESWPPAGENSAAVTVNDNIFCFAGENESGSNKKAFIFDIKQGTWEELPGEASMGHVDGAAAVIGDKVYLIGGEDDSLSNEGFDYAKAVDIYDTKTNRWELGPECPLPRQDTWAVAVGTKIYLLGGQGGNETDAPTDSVLILDTETNKWSEGPTLPYPWENPRAAVVNGKIYVMSGKGEGSYYIFELDPAVGEWKEMESYNVVTRYGCGITTYENKIYLACGRDMSGNALSSIEIYDPALDNYAQ
ncbi:MAG: kelch repeat-containing protein [Atribacterota bacterium]|nr:kelch repeat-containing protein [Atribacterota bacterium]MDD5497646.1 kelch repeat-containing protein [Atribacterota bacterium]